MFSCQASLLFCITLLLSVKALSVSSNYVPLASRQDNSTLSTLTQDALKFEYSTWANGSVYDEPFYTVPKNSTNAVAGSLLKVQRDIIPTNYTIPLGLSLSRLIFQSKSLNGTLVPNSAYVLWPYTPKNESDGYPVVGYAHGTSGVQADCAPSHLRNLWQHFLAPYPLAYQGYVVVAPDYAGQGVYEDADGHHIIHEYFASPAGANDVVYAVQAAQSAFPELSKRFVVMGHSQGAGVTWSIAQRQVKEPVDGYLGAIAVAPVTKHLFSKSILDSSPLLQYGFLLAAQGVVSLFPDFNPADIATAAGAKILSIIEATGGCSSTLDTLFDPTVPPLQDDAFDNPYVQSYLNGSLNGGQQISGPMLVIHGANDTVLNPTTTIQSVKETVEKFPSSQIDFRLYPDLDHNPSLEASQLAWQAWIADRFAEKAAEPFKATEEACHVRPGAFLQPALNWWIALANVIYQTP